MRKKLKRVTGIASAFGGLMILVFVLSPIVSYKSVGVARFKEYLSPVPEGDVYVGGVDYTRASNWFDTADFELPRDESKVRYYSLTIPKLGIKNATVAIGGEDLAKSLIQYPGTALPGKRGNAVIFGHSILPQFFNPKDYLSIFSTLPTMKKGDRIEIRYDGITFSYLVEELFEVKPTDLEILAQNITDSYVTLVTCIPPGHPLRPKRLIVRARLDPLGTIGDNGSSYWN